MFITVTIGAFRMLVQPMVMTGGGPSHSTYTIVYDIYETGTVNWEMDWRPQWPLYLLYS